MKAAQLRLCAAAVTCRRRCAALAQGRGAAKLLAGGQSLGPMLNLRLARPRC